MMKFTTRVLFLHVLVLLCGTVQGQQHKPETGINDTLIPVRQQDDKYLFRIHKNLVGKDLLWVTRVSRGAAGTKNYTGDEIANMVVFFEIVDKKRILLRKRIFQVFPGTDRNARMNEAVTRTNLMPIMAIFKLQNTAADSTAYVIDMEEFFKGDNEGVSLTAEDKMRSRISATVTDKSYIHRAVSYPANLEVSYVKTYTKSDPFTMSNSVTGSSTSAITFEFNTSMILLPEHPMKQRFQDARVGYFSFQQTDYEQAEHGVISRTFIKRWRIEPKPEDVDKYRKGELVEPIKPIVFYIDPLTPEKWIPYLIQGVSDWQAAFEQAGFKNAIMAKRAPSSTEDPAWSLYDARHSAIVFKPSDIQNASGPSIADPRTGEILESHINWYHNVLTLLHNIYFVQCSALDSRAQKAEFSDELIGELVKVVITHEVGHALGLQHNFGASNAYSVAQIRNRAWVEKNGFCASVMDYSRFNYIAQPEDSMPAKALLPRLGVYDKWAIQWGYSFLPQFATSEEENRYLSKWVSAKATDKQLWFGVPNSDPRVQAEDLSDNAILAAEYGIRNLRITMKNLLPWTYKAEEGYEQLAERFKDIIARYAVYMNHASNYIFGTYQTLKSRDQQGAVYEPVSPVLQKQAIDLLDKYVFQTPYWLLDTTVLNRTGQTKTGIIGDLQSDVFENLLARVNFLHLAARNESNFKAGSTLTLIEMLDLCKRKVWSELQTHKPIDIYRRSLQRNYIHHLIEALNRKDARTWQSAITLPFDSHSYITAHDVEAIVLAHLQEVLSEIKRNKPFYKEKVQSYHLGYMVKQIEDALNFSSTW